MYCILHVCLICKFFLSMVSKRLKAGKTFEFPNAFNNFFNESRLGKLNYCGKLLFLIVIGDESG